MTEKQYGKLVQELSPKSPMGRDCLNAFWIGGLICVVGQVFLNLYGKLGLDKDAAGTAASISLVTLVPGKILENRIGPVTEIMQRKTPKAVRSELPPFSRR